MADETTPGDAAPADKAEYDQAFFLDLAAKGKDAWNAWRGTEANNDMRVTFAGVYFGNPPNDQINFAGFEFGDDADFSQCKWRGTEYEKIAELLEEALDPDFHKAGRASFTGAAFGNRASFIGAVFGWEANFDNTSFGDLAVFTRTTFGDGANFDGAAFGNEAQFADAEFRGEVNFPRAAFGDGANFTGANFRDEAKFDKTRFEGSVAFNRERAPFINISFASARFNGEANFSGRSFEKIGDFTNTRFNYPPDFDGVNNPGKIDFTGARVAIVPAGQWLHWTENSLVPIRLRAFRKIAEETKNHDLERDLYIEERKAERGVYLRQRWEDLKTEGWKTWPRNFVRLAIHGFWIYIMFLYWALADYGRNFLVPAIWLSLSVPFFYWRYTKVLTPLMHEAGQVNADKYRHAVWMVALGNAVPFVGPLTIDSEIKKFLFCPGFGSCPLIPPEGFQLLVLGQNLLSIILVFFIGLALRNYFKIK